LSEAEIQANLDAGKPYVIRQKIPREGKTTFHDEIFGDITVDNDTLDDQVLIKRDGLPTYNFANVIDDHLMGITHVVRGSEYLSSTPKYNLLYEGFGWEIPKYIHCSPVMRDQHNKMSKRHGDPSYEDLIAQGYVTEAVVNYVALLGWAPGGEQEIFTLHELEQAFDLKGISKSPAIFDIVKLRYFNSEYLRAMEPSHFAEIAEPYIREAVQNPEIDARAIAPLLQQRCEVLTEIPEKVAFFERLPNYDLSLYSNKKNKLNPESSLELLHAVRPRLAALEEWTPESVLGVLSGLAEEREMKIGKVMWPVRISVSGQAVTPGGPVEICTILGKEESLRRMDAGIAMLEEGAQA
jgi:glutamyl-tRNA synthetase